MKKKRGLACLLSGVLIAAMLSACTGAGSSTQTAETAAQESAAGGAEQGSSEAAESASGETNVVSQAGKESVTIITTAEPQHFDMVGDTSSQNDVIVLNNIYDSLINITADGEYEPSLATDWEMAEDGLSYTFHLREDVTFHNGYPFTAEDVKFTLEGVNERNNGSSLFANFTDAEVIDDYTIKLNLSAPYAAFLTGLASRDGFIQSKQLYEEVGHEGYQENPVGTGPYKFVSRVSGDSITLEANEDYWGGAPAIKDVTIRVITESSTQMITLESGEGDFLLQPALATVLNLTEDSNITWDYISSAARTTMNLNCMEGSPAHNESFRKALQCAINKEDVLIGAMEGYGEVIDIDMSTTYTSRPTDYVAPPAYDPEQAKQYLEEAGYNGEEFSIIVTAGTTAELAAQIVQGQLTEVGINCTVGAYDSSTFTSMWNNGEYGGCIRSNQSSVMDAEALYTFFRTDGSLKNDYPNVDWINEKLLEGREMENGPERIALYTEVVDEITEHALQIPLYSDINIIAYNKALSGVEPHPLNFYRIADWSWQ